MTVRFALLAPVILLCGSISGVALAGHDLDRLAAQLEDEVTEIDFEVDHALRTSPLYRHLTVLAARQSKLAEHIHDDLHHGASPAIVLAELRQLAVYFHQFEDLLDRADHYAFHPAVGRPCLVSPTRSVRRHLRAAESLRCALARELESLVQPRPIHYGGAVGHDLDPALVPYGTVPGPTFRAGGVIPTHPHAGGIGVRVGGVSFRVGR